MSQELKDKIAKMRKGLGNAAIQGSARTALESALAKAEDQLAKAAENAPARSVADTIKTKTKPARVSFSDYPLAAKFMPKHQKNLVQMYEDDDKRQILEGIEANLKLLRVYRSQDGLGDKAIVYAHYFWGQTDHFITETDFEDGNENVFGFTILNGDTQFAELGGIALRELTESKRVELDFYWTPVTLAEAKAKAYPEVWGEQKEIIEPEDVDEVSDIKGEPIKVGQRVRIEGLDRLPDGNGGYEVSPYNEQIGTVRNVQPEDIDVVLDGRTTSIGFHPDNIRVLFLKSGTEILESLKGIDPISIVLNADQQATYNENEEDNDHFLNLQNLASLATDAPPQVLGALEWLEARIKKERSISGDAGPVNNRLVELLRPMKEAVIHRLLGRKITIHLPNGEAHAGQFAIVELDEITASHNERTFASSPGYPTNAQGRNANDRNYADDPQAQALVQQYAQNLQPALLITTSRTAEGTPIITNDGLVVSGNNRTMSLKRAAADYPDRLEEYAKFLMEEMDAFGFDPKDSDAIHPKTKTAKGREYVQGMYGSDFYVFEKPVLVRIDYDITELSTTELAKYNAATTKGKRPIDRSIELSAKLVENVLCGTNIPQIIGEFDTLSDFYADRNAQKKIRDQLIGCNLVTQQELPAYYDSETGHFNEEGKTFIERTLGAAILSADALQAAEADGVKRLRAVVVNALPALLQNKGLARGSLIESVNEATLFQQKMTASGLSFADFLTQKSMFDAVGHAYQAVVLNRLMLVGQRAFKMAIMRYNDSMKANTGDSLFGAETQATPEEAFEKIILAGLPEGDKKVLDRYFSGPKILENPSVRPEVREKAVAAVEAVKGSKVEADESVLKTYQARLKLLQLSLKRLEGDKKKLAEFRVKIITKFLEKHAA